MNNNNKEDNFTKLLSIKNEFKNPNISLKEIKTHWFEAKEIVVNLANSDHLEMNISLDIFQEGAERIDEFLVRWLDEGQKPTDEELDILEEGFNEASWALNFLATNAPDIFSTENNKFYQGRIERIKQIISKEKSTRKQIKDLQSQIDSLQNQPNNEVKVSEFREKIEKLEKNRPNSSSLSSIQGVPQKTIPSNLLGVFCLGFGVCLVLLLIFYFVKKAFSLQN